MFHLSRSRDYDAGLSEMMDRPQPVSAELRDDLDNLEALNLYFGSHSLVRRFLRRWLKAGDTVAVLDLCTGSADIPRLVAHWAHQNGVHVRITGVDFQESTLAIARERCDRADPIELCCCNVLRYDPGQKFDLVLCSLALHHFSESAATQLLRKILNLTSKRALVADLVRSHLGAIGVRLLTNTVFRAPMTRFDARLSMRRAFSFHEMTILANKAGWEKFGHRRFPISRQAIWLE